MRWIIWYIKAIFCKHDLEMLQSTNIYSGGERPVNTVFCYRCRKCGFSHRIKAH